MKHRNSLVFGKTLFPSLGLAGNCFATTQDHWP